TTTAGPRPTATVTIPPTTRPSPGKVNVIQGPPPEISKNGEFDIVIRNDGGSATQFQLSGGNCSPPQASVAPQVPANGQINPGETKSIKFKNTAGEGCAKVIGSLGGSGPYEAQLNVRSQ